MKKLSNLVSFSICLFFACCSSDPRASIPQTGTFGKAFQEDSIYSVEEIMNLDASTKNHSVVQLSGTIDSYCKGEGCWLTVKNTQGESLLTEIENKAFVLPRNIDGKTAVINGVLEIDTVQGKIERRINATGITIK